MRKRALISNFGLSCLIFLLLALSPLMTIAADKDIPSLDIPNERGLNSGSAIFTSNTDGEIVLHWTAPGDDGFVGQAAGYDIRFKPSRFGPIDTELKWQSGIRVADEPFPAPAGQTDSMLVTGLESGESYYFSIKAYDEHENHSGLSNSPEVVASNFGYTISVDTLGWGDVSIEPDKDCYEPGETVILTALPYDSWFFDSWSGDWQGNTNPVSLEIIDDMNITAIFITDFIAGDANGDGLLKSSDITYLLGYIHEQFPAPDPYLSGDANGDCDVNGHDVTYLVNFFRGIGPLPVRGDCDPVFISARDDSESR
ncbi:MAG: hypothetical protein GY839_04585 [candidate division Zixibacteria bacterium]|nr:hypothetical protein [candidate division Zixibacteria bacterium]